MVYIMVTHFFNHWDKLPNGKTQYTKAVLYGAVKKGKAIDNTKTLFIKVEKESGKFERAWLGKSKNFKETIWNGKEAIEFEVGLEEEIPEDLVGKYAKYKKGWHAEDELVFLSPEKNILDPNFFDVLKRTKDWSEFEDYSFYLLKSLGLHEIYKFPQKDQAGKADGFFMFGSLVVLFDATLKEDFEEVKKDQVENFCHKLNSGKLTYGKNEFDITQYYSKQVWIITKGNSRVIKSLNNITVKEVSVDRLMKIYRRRLEENLNGKALEKLLQEI